MLRVQIKLDAFCTLRQRRWVPLNYTKYLLNFSAGSVTVLLHSYGSSSLLPEYLFFLLSLGSRRRIFPIHSRVEFKQGNRFYGTRIYFCVCLNLATFFCFLSHSFARFRKTTTMTTNWNYPHTFWYCLPMWLSLCVNIVVDTNNSNQFCLYVGCKFRRIFFLYVDNQRVKSR